MAIVHDGTNSAAAKTVSHTLNSGSGNNRLVIIACVAEATTDINTPTYNGSSTGVTLISQFNGSGADIRVEVYYVKDADLPAGAGSYTVTYTGGGTPSAGIAVAAYTGVDQTTPHDAPVTDTTDLTSPLAITTTSAVDDLCIDVIGVKDHTGTLTVDGGQTQRANVGPADLKLGLSEEAGAASVTMQWTLTTVSIKGHVIFSLNPAAAAGGGVGGGGHKQPKFFINVMH